MKLPKTRASRVLSISAVCLAALILFTVLSKAVYNMTLPNVKTASVLKSTLSGTYTGNGTVSYPQIASLNAKSDVTVVSAAAGIGVSVRAGQPLFSIAVGDADNRRVELELEALRIKNSILDLGGTVEGSFLRDLTAPFYGELAVSEELKAGQTVEAGQIVGEIKGGEPYVTFHLYEDEAGRLSLNETVTLFYTKNMFRTYSEALVKSIKPEGGGSFVVDMSIMGNTEGIIGQMVFYTYSSGSSMGSIAYVGPVEALAIPYDGVVESVNMTDGGFYNPGEVLVKLAPDDNAPLTPQIERKISELRLSLELANRRLADHNELYPQGGQILAPATGVVTYMPEVGQTVAEGGTLCLISDPGAVPEVTAVVSSEIAGSYRIGDEIKFVVEGFDPSEGGGLYYVPVTSTIKAMSRSSRYGEIIITADIVTTMPLYHGMWVGVNLSYETMEHDTVVAPECVMESDGKTGVIYAVEPHKGVFGTEYRLRRIPVRVMLKTPQAAVLASDVRIAGLTIVRDSNAALADGAVVFPVAGQ